MESYIGTKIITAEPMSKNEFRRTKGEAESGSVDEAGYKVVYPDGYVSWSPKKVFEDAYRLVALNEKKLVVDNYYRNPESN